MEIIIRGTPEECKKAIKELAEKEKEYVPIYPHYYGEMWKWYPSWYFNPTITATGTSGTYSSTSISADDIKQDGNISTVINDAIENLINSKK